MEIRQCTLLGKVFPNKKKETSTFSVGPSIYEWQPRLWYNVHHSADLLKQCLVWTCNFMSVTESLPHPMRSSLLIIPGVGSIHPALHLQGKFWSAREAKLLPKESSMNCFGLLVWCYTGLKSCRSARWRHLKSRSKAIAECAFPLSEISIRKLRISFSEFNKRQRSPSVVQMCPSGKAVKEIGNCQFVAVAFKEKVVTGCCASDDCTKQIQNRVRFFVFLSRINTLLEEVLNKKESCTDWTCTLCSCTTLSISVCWNNPGSTDGFVSLRWFFSGFTARGCLCTLGSLVFTCPLWLSNFSSYLWGV